MRKYLHRLLLELNLQNTRTNRPVALTYLQVTKFSPHHCSLSSIALKLIPRQFLVKPNSVSSYLKLKRKEVDKKNLRNDNKRILMTEQTEYISMNALVCVPPGIFACCAFFLTIEPVGFLVQLDNKN